MYIIFVRVHLYVHLHLHIHVHDHVHHLCTDYAFFPLLIFFAFLFGVVTTMLSSIPWFLLSWFSLLTCVTSLNSVLPYSMC